VKAIPSLLSFAALLSLSLALPACADDQTDVIGTPDGSNGGNPDGASNNNGDGANGANPDGNTAGQTCSSACQTDIQCQNRCPQLDGGVYCCDLSNLCYPSQTATCGGTDAGSNLPD
jgi:hypothetical protein